MRSTCSRRSPRTRPSSATGIGRTCSATARSRRARSAAELLDLHGEPKALYAFSDPLCDALQVLNHLQDCQTDYRSLDRVYLPLDRFAAARIGVEELGRPSASPALRRVLDDTLEGVDQLLRAAQDLPRALASRRLAAESAVILAIARRLAALLRQRDPLAERVELGRAAFLQCALRGLAGLIWTRRRPLVAGAARPMPR